MSVPELLLQFEDLYINLQIQPNFEEILEHIVVERRKYFKNFMSNAKISVLSSMKNGLTSKERKHKLKRSLKTARRHAKHKYNYIKPYKESILNSEDGWKNRMRYGNDIIFVIKGYAVVVNSDHTNLVIKDIRKTQILVSLLKFVNVIMHLNQHNCTIDEQLLNNKLNALKAILTTTYSDYLPTPCKLRRSYNCNLYDQVANITVENGWENKTVCWFDENCYIFKMDGIKYTVDIYDGKIDKIMEF